MSRVSRAPAGGPEPGTHTIDTGQCTISADRDGGGWLVEINGVQSSHVPRADPTRLDFEYMRWIAAVVAERFDPGEPLRVLHLGAGACTLPCHLIARYPRSRHVAVDVDAALAAVIRNQFTLPRSPVLRIRVGDARTVVESLTPGSRDLVVVDAFAGAVTPAHLTTVEFDAAVARVVRPGGVVVHNCVDTRDRLFVRRRIATLAEQFEHLMLIADPAMLKGRRYGNVILAASDAPLPASPALVRDLLVDAVPASVRHDTATRAFAGSAIPIRDVEVAVVPG